jgi:hypothetical protein
MVNNFFKKHFAFPGGGALMGRVGCRFVEQFFG